LRVRVSRCRGDSPEGDFAVNQRISAKRIAFLFTLALLAGWFVFEKAAGESATRAVTSPQAAAPTIPRGEDQCVACHRELDGELAAPVAAMQQDAHQRRGFSCSSCHGGDPAESDAALSMDPQRGFVGRPSPAQVPSLCGSCHSNAGFMRRYNPAQRVDQVPEYFSSAHGKGLQQGNMRVATCISCHGAHGIRPASHPQSAVHPVNVASTCGTCHSDSNYMAASSLPRDQVEKYDTSVHAKALYEKNDLSAPTCNDCHGNHGAAPPGVKSVANVCGNCHTRQAELFRGSPHSAAFESMGFAECLVCHNNHDILSSADDMLGVAEGSSCLTCHSEGDAGYQVAGKMKQSIDGLEQHLYQAQALLDRAARAGMEVSSARFQLSQGRDVLVNSRVIVHSFSESQLEEEIGTGLKIAQTAHQLGLQALQELDFRRKGLAASLLVIVLALAAVRMKIRDIERRKD
jgi:hypothetical protein